jgi:hypothetical protein
VNGYSLCHGFASRQGLAPFSLPGSSDGLTFANTSRYLQIQFQKETILDQLSDN